VWSEYVGIRKHITGKWEKLKLSTHCLFSSSSCLISVRLLGIGGQRQWWWFFVVEPEVEADLNGTANDLRGGDELQKEKGDGGIIPILNGQNGTFLVRVALLKFFCFKL
jgi:hypothetical protein